MAPSASALRMMLNTCMLSMSTTFYCIQEKHNLFDSPYLSYPAPRLTHLHYPLFCLLVNVSSWLIEPVIYVIFYVQIYLILMIFRCSKVAWVSTMLRGRDFGPPTFLDYDLWNTRIFIFTKSNALMHFTRVYAPADNS